MPREVITKMQDPGLLPDLSDRAPEQIVLSPVRNVEYKWPESRLPIDYFPGRIVQGNAADLVALPPNFDFVIADTAPAEIERFGFSEPRIDGKHDEVSYDALDRRLRFCGDLAGSRDYFLEILGTYRADRSIFLVKLHLRDWVCTLVNFPIQGKVIEFPKERTIAVRRGLARQDGRGAFLWMCPAILGPDPHAELLHMIGRNLVEARKPLALEVADHGVEVTGFRPDVTWFRIPRPCQIFRGEVLEAKAGARLAVSGFKFYGLVSGAFEREPIFVGMERDTMALGADAEIQTIDFAALS